MERLRREVWPIFYDQQGACRMVLSDCANLAISDDHSGRHSFGMSTVRGLGLLALAACSARAAAPPVAVASSSSPSNPNPAGDYAYTLTRTGDIHDFDFIAGAWTLQNRRLKRRLVGSNDWEEFP